MYPLLAFYLRRLFQHGELQLETADGRIHRFGDGSGQRVALRLRSRKAELIIAHNPALALGECYMNGELDMVEGTIMDLVRLACENAGKDATREPWMRALERGRLLFRRTAQNNVPKRSRRNVQHHYDLSRELYALFLDPDLQYSCAYFERPDQTLSEAQLAKKRHIAAKLNIQRPGLRILDIGSGWGGMGLYLADVAGADVTGITLSDEQLALSRERAHAAGRDDRVHFRLQDYRHIHERFDRIVSVGMFEHVGRDFYDTFFAQAEHLLEDDGVMLLHTIGRSTAPANTNAFIEKHIFPGGYTPALSEILPAIEKAGLIVTDVEVLRLHYAETCRAWREAFMARRQEARSTYDERFCRMWEFYLAIAEAGFRWQGLVVFQIQLTRRVEALPITRDYIAEGENRFRAREAPSPRVLHRPQEPMPAVH
ncbi:cyclopropane-fatty-acyl-phospholipid synthase family protein [Aureimonas sp. ME7]|uniref:SAM-dependent methyltransferase n=1 Tax=Aureimonas sp. ME7 TaxID=2744252 RepID=UPI0015F757CA|nr:cyclopropane-fatty-acyl-phospholipid synthase family protein [Aureimonas sp. ME7]